VNGHPFDSYLTVNLDPLLALKSRTARIPCAPKVNSYLSLDRKAIGKRSIHYLHGYIAEGMTPTRGTIVLARSEFDEAYADNSNLMNFLVPTLENDPIVFIGCRLREPVMKEVFPICKKHQDKRLRAMKEREEGASAPPPRFILLAPPEVRTGLGEVDAEQTRRAIQAEEAYYKAFDITTVWYPACEGNHSALRYALENLAGLTPMTPKYGWEEGLYAT